MQTDRSRTRVVLVDDHEVVRRGLAALLRDEGFDVAAVAASATEAQAVLGHAPADVVVLDLSLDPASGFGVLEWIRERIPDTRVAIYSVHEEGACVRLAIAGGALGYVTKREDPEVLVECVDHVRRGERFLSPRVARVLAEAPAAEPCSEATGP